MSRVLIFELEFDLLGVLPIVSVVNDTRGEARVAAVCVDLPLKDGA